MKKLLILGASIYQVPLISTARRMGLHTIVSSIPGNYPGFDLADQVYTVNTTDREATLRIAEKEGIDGICTTGTDVAVATVGYVNEHLGLSGISVEAAMTAADKFTMKEAFREKGVSAAAFRRVYTAEEAHAAAQEIGYPVIVKCVDSSGSRGVTAVKDPDGIDKAFADAIRYSRRDYALVEQTLMGEEIGVDGMICGGEMILLAPHRKFTYSTGGITMPSGHGFPYECSDKVLESIRREIGLAVEAIGLDNCAFNSDVFIDGDQAYIIEIGGRAGATCIPELISRHWHCDFYEMIINNALGITPEMSQPDALTPCMAKLLMSPVDGVITHIRGEAIDGLRGGEGDTAITLDFGVGDAVEAMINGTTRIGHVITNTSDPEELDRIMSQVYENIFVNGRSLKEQWDA